MDLTDASVPASTQYLGNETVVVSAEKHLKIDTSPQGEDILDAVVPIGKSWKVKLHLEIIETDA